MLQGDQHLEPVIQEGYPRERRVNDSWVLEDKWRINADLVYEFLPDIGTTDEKGRSPRDVLIVTVPGTEGKIKEVTIQWKEPGTESLGSTDRQPGSIIFDSDTRVTEKTIQSHPDWEGLSDDQKKKAQEYNLNSFSLVTVTFKRSEIIDKNNFSFTEEVIVGNVNKNTAPTGLKNPTTGAWKNMGRNIRSEVGNNVEIVESWQYDQELWQGIVTPDQGSLNDVINSL